MKLYVFWNCGENTSLLIETFINLIREVVSWKWTSLLNSDFNKSQYSATFLNQLLSYAMVNRYGGYALNFDTLLIKSILGLNSNFLTKCSEDSIEDLPYFLHHKHPLMDDVLSQLSKGFNMNVSQSIGRNLITKIVKQECDMLGH